MISTIMTRVIFLAHALWVTCTLTPSADSFSSPSSHNVALPASASHFRAFHLFYFLQILQPTSTPSALQLWMTPIRCPLSWVHQHLFVIAASTVSNGLLVFVWWFSSRWGPRRLSDNKMWYSAYLMNFTCVICILCAVIFYIFFII